ncbi:MAG: hypothetical protein GWN79_19365, partial [Actinobacteria bacterium]|nr:hypothetical protein [Actinomycetota bacterium]
MIDDPTGPPATTDNGGGSGALVPVVVVVGVVVIGGVVIIRRRRPPSSPATALNPPGAIATYSESSGESIMEYLEQPGALPPGRTYD